MTSTTKTPQTAVGVLDRAAQILAVLESGPASLRVLVEETGLHRATVHRIAGALIVHGLVARDRNNCYILGARLKARR